MRRYSRIAEELALGGAKKGGMVGRGEIECSKQAQ